MVRARACLWSPEDSLGSFLPPYESWNGVSNIKPGWWQVSFPSEPPHQPLNHFFHMCAFSYNNICEFLVLFCLWLFFFDETKIGLELEAILLPQPFKPDFCLVFITWFLVTLSASSASYQVAVGYSAHIVKMIIREACLSVERLLSHHKCIYEALRKQSRE